MTGVRRPLAALKRPRGVTLTIAFLNLAYPAALFLLLRPILVLHHGTIGNLPSIIERGAVAAVFAAATLTLVTGLERVGLALTCFGVALNVALIVWFWVRSGVVFNLEVAGWLVVDAMLVLLLLLARTE
jgi:hypothetical protein